MLLLDSAHEDEIRRAGELGYVQGATSNPTLVARSGRDAMDVVGSMLSTFAGPVFFQPAGETPKAIIEQSLRISSLDERRVVLKLPCTLAGLAASARLGGLTYAFTAVFTPAQAIVAAAAGGRYLLPYLNRITRLTGDGAAVIRQLVTVAPTVELVVASIKSPEEAVEAILAGAHHLTAPLSVLEAMAESVHTGQAMDEFRQTWEGR
ncbi:MAG: transaldolase family protein [Dehalococcoidia bacterium]